MMKKKQAPLPDVSVEDHGTVILIQPISAAAKAWVDEKVQTELWMGPAFAVEPRLAPDIIYGMMGDGLEVQG